MPSKCHGLLAVKEKEKTLEGTEKPNPKQETRDKPLLLFNKLRRNVNWMIGKFAAERKATRTTPNHTFAHFRLTIVLQTKSMLIEPISTQYLFCNGGLQNIKMWLIPLIKLESDV